MLHLGVLPNALKPLLAAWLPEVAALAAQVGLLGLALPHWVEQPAYPWLTGRPAAA